MSGKAEIRRIIRGEIAARSQAELLAASDKICAAISSLPIWENARAVGLFAPQTTEPFIDPLFTMAREAGKRVFYPRVAADRLDFAEVRDMVDLVEGRWRLREPVSVEESLPAAPLDVLLVPGLAFTTEGARLGRGGGYYDRALGNVPREITVGVCFSFQVVATLPTETHDRLVGCVVTETGPV